MGKKKTFLVGHIGVDSGLVFIGDPGTILSEDAPDWDEFLGILDDKEQTTPALDGAPIALAMEPLGPQGGLVFPSGVGDGIYPVYITLANDGKVESAFITFT